MSEYWLSHKKYFCKYCEIYITDDVPSRRQHESGLRHKGNRERFVRNLYKQGERRNKDLEEEKREMARVEAAASAAYARDVSAGHASLASSSSHESRPAKVPKKTERAKSVWSDYTTAQSLGITDPDEERMNAEMELRRIQGVVGQWEVVAPPPPPLPAETQSSKEEDSKEPILSDSLPQKRQAGASFEDEDDRSFKLRKRTVGTGLGEIWDPGNIPIKLKTKSQSNTTLEQSRVKEEPATTPLDGFEPRQSSPSPTREKTQSQQALGQVSQTGNSERSKWQSMKWKCATEAADIVEADTKGEIGRETKSDNVEPSVKGEDTMQPHSDQFGSRHVEIGIRPRAEASHSELAPSKLHVKVEDTVALATCGYRDSSEPAGGLFKKRKIPTAARGKRE